MFTKNSHQTGNDIKQAERHILNRWYPCSNPHTTPKLPTLIFGRGYPANSGDQWEIADSMVLRCKICFVDKQNINFFFNLRSKSSVKIMVYPWQNYILNTNRLSNISVGFITSDTHNKILNLKIPKVFK